MNKRYYVYVIINKVNNKKYIGWTGLLPDKRFYNHVISARRNSQTLLHKAIRKYGEQNWDVKILDVLTSASAAMHTEKLWIKQLKTTCFCLAIMDII